MVQIVKSFMVPMVFGMIIPSIITVFIILWFEPHPVTRFSRDVWPTTVEPGEIVNIRATVMRSKGGCPSVVARTWYDELGNIVSGPEFQEVPGLPAGGETFATTIKIPMTILPGKVTLRTVVTFNCNMVQSIAGGSALPLHDIIFKVVP